MPPDGMLNGLPSEVFFARLHGLPSDPTLASAGLADPAATAADAAAMAADKTCVPPGVCVGFTRVFKPC